MTIFLCILAGVSLVLAVLFGLEILDRIDQAADHRSRMVWAFEHLADAANQAARSHTRLANSHGQLTRSTVDQHQRAAQLVEGLAAGLSIGLGLGLDDGTLPDLSAFFPADQAKP